MNNAPRKRAPVVDFSDRDTMPADLLDETRLPEPEVTELFGQHGRRAFLEAVRRQGGEA